MRGFTREALRKIIPGLTEAQETALIGLYLDAVKRLKQQIAELKKGTEGDKALDTPGESPERVAPAEGLATL